MRESRGGILALFLVTILALLSIGAVALELYLSSLSDQQAEYYARLGALAAIEGYYSNPDPTLSGQARFNFATQRVQQVLTNNYVLSNGHVGPQVSNSNVLQPGRWGTCANGSECFTPINNLATQSPNAFQISGALYSNGILTKFVTEYLHVRTLASQVRAVARIVPRRACFLVDVSGSVVDNTHNVNTGSFVSQQQRDDIRNLRTGPQSFYAYPVNVPNAPPLFDMVFNTLPANRSGSPTPIHSQADFGSSITTVGNSSYDPTAYPPEYYYGPDQNGTIQFPVRDLSGAPSNTGYTYRIDNVVAPEPLMSIFAGLNSSVQLFKSRGVAGDQACFIFFDQDLTWPRIIKMNSNWDLMLEKTDASNHLNDILTNGEFPGVRANTNLVGAIDLARTQIKNARAVIPNGNDFIVLISDGLGNCVCPEPLGYYSRDRYFQKTDCSTEPNCGNNFKYYMESSEKLRSMTWHDPDADPATDVNMNAEDIPIHVIQLGNSVGPNTVDIMKDGKCLTDAEFRALPPSELAKMGLTGFSYVYQPPEWTFADSFYSVAQELYLNRSAQDPYYVASALMYQLARLTRGMYIPIRPRAASCPAGATVTTPQTACGDASQSTNIGYGNTRYGPQQLVRRYDPYCRTVQQQVTEALQSIFDQSPFSVVSVDVG